MGPFIVPLQAEDTKQEENGKVATSASSLPADYTLKGNLVDPDAEIQGVPPARASNAKIELAPSTPGSEMSFTEPSDQAKNYHDDAGIHSQSSCPEMVLHDRYNARSETYLLCSVYNCYCSFSAQLKWRPWTGSRNTACPLVWFTFRVASQYSSHSEQ